MKSISRKGFLVRGTATQEVAISMEDAFWVLERGLGFTDAYSLGVRDGRLVRAEDVSHHGSPEYEYTELSNNPKWAELFRAFQRLREYMNHADSPEWARHIEPEQEETQDGPTMQL